MKILAGLITPIILLSGPAAAQTTNCTTNYVGSVAYTSCSNLAQSQGQSLNYASQFDPNAFVKGAAAGQQFQKIQNENLAYYALAHGQPERAIKYLYTAGDIQQAQALEDRLNATRQASAVGDANNQNLSDNNRPTESDRPVTVDGIVYTPAK